MEGLEQENQVLHEEVASMKTKMEEFTSMKTKMEELTQLVKLLTTTHNPPPPSPPINTQAEAGPSTILGWTVSFNTPQQTIPEGCPWGVPISLGEVFHPYVSEAQMHAAQNVVLIPPAVPACPQASMTYSAPVIYTIPKNEEPIFHSRNMEAYARVDDLQEKYEMMNREMKALRGKEVLKKDVYDMCLVPNVQIPHKFKLPDFEKYKGTSCPKDHLTIYVRKMSTYVNDHQVLINYFQDSLTGAALKWHMNLKRAKIQTFNDLREAFVKQYKFNVDTVPNRSDLQAMTQKDNETFREYAQRWRNIAAQVSPHVEEKEMTKVFLKTLSQFYYEKMVGSVPRDFTEMVSMGVQLEEGVREGRLVKESVSAGSSKRKEQEVSMVKGRP